MPLDERGDIEVWDDPAATWGIGLPARLEALGWKPVVVTSPACHSRHGMPCALIVNGLLPVDWLQACVALHGTGLRDGSLTGLVVARSLPEARREALRREGFSLFLGVPFDEAALRFQTNRAFLGSREAGPPRREARVPVHMASRARSASREKPVSLYTLSSGGAFLETPRPWIAGMKLEVDLPGPDGPVPVRSEVCYTNVPGNCMNPRAPVGMGVRFEDLDGGQRKALEATIRERNASLLL